MQKFTQKLIAFMTGRYGLYARGFDTLSKWMFYISLGLTVISIPFFGVVRLILSVAAFALLGWVIFRFLSKNINARQNENMRFIRMTDDLRMLFGGMTEGDKKIYRCPKCRTKVRVPKGRGKIRITCPKCKAEFIKKT